MDPAAQLEGPAACFVCARMAECVWQRPLLGIGSGLANGTIGGKKLARQTLPERGPEGDGRLRDFKGRKAAIDLGRPRPSVYKKRSRGTRRWGNGWVVATARRPPYRNEAVEQQSDHRKSDRQLSEHNADIRRDAHALWRAIQSLIPRRRLTIWIALESLRPSTRSTTSRRACPIFQSRRYNRAHSSTRCHPSSRSSPLPQLESAALPR